MGAVNVKFVDNSQIFKSAKDSAVEKALEAIGQQAENYAKIKCPVDTGNLRNSIIHQRKGKFDEIIATDVNYAPYVEYGTRRSKAQPFLKPAATEHTAEYRQIVMEQLKNA